MAQGEMHDETIREMDILIKGEPYHLDVGEVNLITKDKFSIEYPLLATYVSIGQYQQLYNDGLGRLWGLCDFVAEEDMVLTELQILEDEFEILDLFVSTIGSSGVIDFSWDGETPIDISKGDYVSMELVYRNKNTDALGYTSVLHAMLLCETESGISRIMEEKTITSCLLNFHELYAIAFDGVDMESYYKDYYYPMFESWREDYLAR